MEINVPTVVLYPRPFDHDLIVEKGTQANLVWANITFKNVDANLFAAALPDYVQIATAQAGAFEDVTDFYFPQAARADIGHRFVLDRLCDVVVFEVIRHALKQGLVNAGMLAGMSDPAIRRALEAFHKGISGNWTVDTLAYEASMSRSTFSAGFKNW